jgi:hypothetical protein
MTDLDSIRRVAMVGVGLAIAVAILTGPMYFTVFGFDRGNHRPMKRPDPSQPG